LSSGLAFITVEIPSKMRLKFTSMFIGMIMLSCPHVVAQEYYNRDSLKRELDRAKADTNKVWLFLKLGQQYETNDTDSALIFYESALKLSEELKYMRGMISFYTNATYVYNVKGMYDTALQMNLKSVELAKAFGDRERLSATLANVAASYTMLDQREKAIAIYLEIIPLFENMPETVGYGVINENLCMLYNEINQHEKAKTYGQKALIIFKKLKNDYGKASALNNLAIAHMSLAEYDKSIVLLEEGQTIARKINDQYVLMSISLNLANVNIDLGNFEAIKRHCENALAIAKKLNDPVAEAIALRGLAIHYFNMNQPVEAERYAKQSLQNALAQRSLKHAGKAYSVLAEIAILKKNFLDNTTYSIKSDSIRNVLMNESIARNIQNIEAKYETEKKEQQIRDLQQEAEITDLSFQRNKLFNAALIGSLIFVMVIAFLARHNYRQNKKLLTQENQVQQARIGQLENEKQILAGEAVVKGQEEERGRLAKDLHDGLGGLLSGIKFSFASVKGNLTMTSENHQAFERSMDMLDSSIREMRRVAHNMMPEALVRFGLDTALKDYCNDINLTGALKISYQSIGTKDENFDKTTTITIYRIVQELITNTMKHSAAKTAIVQLTKTSNQLSVTVEDDGKGFDTSLIKQSRGVGWTNIQHRVNFLKGKLDVDSGPAKGTSVHIEFDV
jgi:two-component system NarL family sensor kinase